MRVIFYLAKQLLAFRKGFCFVSNLFHFCNKLCLDEGTHKFCWLEISDTSCSAFLWGCLNVMKSVFRNVIEWLNRKRQLFESCLKPVPCWCSTNERNNLWKLRGHLMAVKLWWMSCEFLMEFLILAESILLSEWQMAGTEWGRFVNRSSVQCFLYN